MLYEEIKVGYEDLDIIYADSKLFDYEKRELTLLKESGDYALYKYEGYDKVYFIITDNDWVDAISDNPFEALARVHSEDLAISYPILLHNFERWNIHKVLDYLDRDRKRLYMRYDLYHFIENNLNGEWPRPSSKQLEIVLSNGIETNVIKRWSWLESFCCLKKLRETKRFALYKTDDGYYVLVHNGKWVSVIGRNLEDMEHEAIKEHLVENYEALLDYLPAMTVYGVYEHLREAHDLLHEIEYVLE